MRTTVKKGEIQMLHIQIPTHLHPPGCVLPSRLVFSFEYCFAVPYTFKSVPPYAYTVLLKDLLLLVSPKLQCFSARISAFCSSLDVAMVNPTSLGYR